MKQNLFFIMLLAMVFSCNSDDPIEVVDKPGQEVEDPDDDSPQKKTNIFFTPYSDSGHKDTNYSQYWGTAQKEGSILHGDSLTPARPVIDLESMFEDDREYFSARRILSSEFRSFILSDPKKYAQSTSFSDKALNELLPSGKFNQSGRLFSEVINVRQETAYRFMESSIAKRRIAERYLLPEFLAKLHTNPIDKVVDAYGPYLLMDFVTGYKTVVFYTGIYKGDASESVKQAEFSNYISAINHSVDTIDQEGNPAVFEYIYTDKKCKNKHITDVELSIQNIGGGGEFCELSHLSKVDGIKVHLTPWAKTFNSNNLAIMPNEDDGLLPLYEFLLEENFKERAKEYIDEGKTPPAMQQPCIEIVKQSDEADSYLRVYLVTRFGDKVLIDSRKLSLDEDATQLAEVLKKEKQQIFHMNFLYREAKPTETIKSFSFNGMDVKKVKKFVKNGMTYLYYWEGIKRYAFTVSNDQVIDAYGIREWVNEMEMLEKLGSTGCIFIGL